MRERPDNVNSSEEEGIDDSLSHEPVDDDDCNTVYVNAAVVETAGREDVRHDHDRRSPLEGFKSHPVWKHRNRDELSELPQLQLCSLLGKLRVIVEGVSTELVVLLQERDGLEEEVDTRNIAIEQLLKIQKGMAWHLSPPLAVQMGVVLKSPADSRKDRGAKVVDKDNNDACA